ncbi:MAG TPA: AAA family ATPase [Bacteroidales bacterium]|jgi:exodeoxyribonuclease-5|nr:AAA family ATPase [Bacteroidales bacterium]MCZ2416587.1 AAA family ATPase [Burkholderiales bacterium]OQC58727.1 MAG: ATP-dependent RecD-like DNA helicase [Bacteroidetes bacterium ADurb.Bin013]MBV6455787.1 ATP-dependent RecD-like DNA helicase [Bacteroidales bacterium]MCZ2316073.1 AAA family ATPase [Bacteroidales bacterium]
MAIDQFIFEKLRENLPFAPSSDQDVFFRAIASFLSGPNPVFILNGYAGTGKTTAMAALVGALSELNRQVVLLAPTGRSAKVLMGYAGAPAHTIHKAIYRQKPPASSDEGGFGVFELHPNRDKNTLFIVDEASLLSNTPGGMLFGSGNLLEDLVAYVFNGKGNQLLILGDSAQLPPIGLELSPALDPGYMEQYGSVVYMEMKEVLRQSFDSGILYNATLLRDNITAGDYCLPEWKTAGFNDVRRIESSELMECLNDAISRYGLEEVVVLCRSNKRANRYNKGIRGSILYREEGITKGDRVMVVKNCYQFLEDVPEMDFIANGDIAEILRIYKFHERYGFRFAEAVLRFPDYKETEISARLLLDTLESESPALSREQQEQLYQGVYSDYEHIKGKRKRYNAVREDLYLNALQVKYANAVTCHKAQGGQWKAVFVDKAFFGEICDKDMLRWYYTAFTRAREQLYLINL